MGRGILPPFFLPKKSAHKVTNQRERERGEPPPPHMLLTSAAEAEPRAEPHLSPSNPGCVRACPGAKCVCVCIACAHESGKGSLSHLLTTPRVKCLNIIALILNCSSRSLHNRWNSPRSVIYIIFTLSPIF